jgi:uncharacterized peroxidase-related enzyme
MQWSFSERRVEASMRNGNLGAILASRRNDMTRLKLIDPAESTGVTQELFAEAHERDGVVTNMLMALANSPLVFSAFQNLQNRLHESSIASELFESIGLTVSQANRCEFGLSYHAAMARTVGMSEDAILDARRGVSLNPKSSAVLAFAQSLMACSGQVSDEELSKVRQYGITDEHIVEIIGIVSLCTFADHLNNVALTPNSFRPAVPLAER